MDDEEKMHLRIKNPQILVRNCKFRTVDGPSSTIYGKSYTIFDPRNIPYYRQWAGLPAENTGEMIVYGQINLRTAYQNWKYWFAQPINQGRTAVHGGLPIELWLGKDVILRNAKIIKASVPF